MPITPDHAELRRGAGLRVRQDRGRLGARRPTTPRWSPPAGTCWSNEASLWPSGQFVTTELVATQSFISQHPTVVSDLLKGQIEANSFIASNKSAAEAAANAELASLSGKSLKPAILAAAFDAGHLHQRPDRVVADHRRGITPWPSACSARSRTWPQIYDLGPLNKLLAADGQSQVSS